MYISKLKIVNFKCFKDTEITFDENFNLIIGENNSGKSTIFDALRLWQLAFHRFLKDRTHNQGSSFRAQKYFSFTIDDISFLRTNDFSNLFRSKSSGLSTFQIIPTFMINRIEISLPIIFRNTTEGQVIRFELCHSTSDRVLMSQNISLAQKIARGSDFKPMLLITYINPIFQLPLKEPKFAQGYILNKLHEAKANEVIRNLLFDISPEKKRIKKQEIDDKLVELQNSLMDILEIDNISFSKRLEDEESFIKVFSKHEATKTEVEINQLGSGTINVLNILSVLAYGDYENFWLNVLLLDEPDSHLHFNHQSRLYRYLEKVSKDKNKQIIVVTHNSSLIAQFEEVLYIQRSARNINTISLEEYLNKFLVKIDEPHAEIIRQLNENKIKIQEQETELQNFKKPVIYCEGTSDVSLLKDAYLKLYGKEFFEDRVHILDGGGEGGVGSKVRNNRTENIVIGILDNDRAGQTPFKNSIKDNGFKNLNNFHCHNKQNHLIILPIPESRLASSDYFEENTFIEYLLNDETLENKLGIKLEQYRGNTYKRFSKTKGELEGAKSKIHKNIRILEASDYQNFIPLFEEIAKILSFDLPVVSFENLD